MTTSASDQKEKDYHTDCSESSPVKKGRLDFINLLTFKVAGKISEILKMVLKLA